VSAQTPRHVRARDVENDAAARAIDTLVRVVIGRRTPRARFLKWLDSATLRPRLAVLRALIAVVRT
jgi:hypothetical protein